jgi:hypothetical protein
MNLHQDNRPHMSDMLSSIQANNKGYVLDEKNTRNDDQFGEETPKDLY